MKAECSIEFGNERGGQLANCVADSLGDTFGAISP